jgi:hypothetical protein
VYIEYVKTINILNWSNQESLERVLGLNWNTEKAEISVDMMINYGEKIKGRTWRRTLILTS